MANEASAALSDAYGHVMHGDDAGSSARIVWVVRPSRVPCNTGGGIVGGTTNNNSGDGLSTISAPGGVDALTSTPVALNGGDGISPTSSSYFPTASLFTQKFGEFCANREHRESMY
jgi:hypothetical protein